MPDAKVSLGVEVKGADAAAATLDGVAKATQGVSDAARANSAASNENTGAVQQNSAAKSENSARQDANAAATAANTKAQQANAGANDAAAAASKRAAEMQKMFADRVRVAQSRTHSASKETKAFGTSLKGATDFTAAANQAQAALGQLMAGNVVGAFKSAAGAVKSFTKACLLNPVLAVVIALSAAVAGLAKMWSDATAKLKEYNSTPHQDKVRALHNKAEDVVAGGNRFSGMSDQELELARIEAQMRDEEARERVQRDLEKSKSAKESSQRHGIVANADWGGRRRLHAERAERRLEKALEHQEATGAELSDVEAEIARRKQPGAKATKAERDRQAAQRAEDRRKQEQLDARRADFEAEKRYDAIEAGSGKLASLEARKADLQKRLASPFLKELDPSGYLDAEEKLHAVEQKITAEKERQADLEKKAAEESKAWHRGKELARMDAGDRVKYIEKEMAELGKGPRTAENAAKMRGLIDQRDAAKKEAEGNAKAQADWERGRKLEKMDAGARAKYIESEMAELRQGPRTAETEAKMRSLVDQRDAAKKEAAAFEEQKQSFLHRNDTAAQKMSAIGKQLKEAGASGDQAKMLELMMSGAELAEDYDGPMTKKQQRRAEKKAQRDQKAAVRAAKALKRQISGLEKGWQNGDEKATADMAKMAAGGNASALEKISKRAAAGDKSAREMAAQLTSAKNGVPSSIQEKDGKLVKVEGQDRTNQLLEKVVEVLG